MNQLTFFNENNISTESSTKEVDEILIPRDVICPLESKEKLNSIKFNEERSLYVKYVEAIQSQYGLSFIKAREKFFEHRDMQKPIRLDLSFLTTVSGSFVID